MSHDGRVQFSTDRAAKLRNIKENSIFSVIVKCPHSKAFFSVYCVIVIRRTAPAPTAVCHSSSELAIFSFFRAASAPALPISCTLELDGSDETLKLVHSLNFM